MYRILRDQVGIKLPKLYSILTLAEMLSQQEYDDVFVPSAKTPVGREALNNGLDTGLDGLITYMFGPYYTNEQKGSCVFYPNVTG
jgi:hypothetical protein